MSVNARGPLFLVQEALPYLAESRHAAVLNVVSVAAFIFSPNVAIYAAGKSALMTLTRSMAAAYADRGIRVNALAPGSVYTDMVSNNPPEFLDDNWSGLVPLKYNLPAAVCMSKNSYG